MLSRIDFVCFCVVAFRGKRKETIILNVCFSLSFVTYNSVLPIFFFNSESSNKREVLQIFFFFFKKIGNSLSVLKHRAGVILSLTTFPV